MANSAAPPEGGVTPAPAPRPGCPSSATWALSPPSAPSLLPPAPALQPSLRRPLCLNFRGRSRRRREAGRGTGTSTGQGHPSSLHPGPSILLPALAAWEGCGDLKPTATAGSASSSGASRYPRPRDPSPAPLPETPPPGTLSGTPPGTSSRGSLSSLASGAAAPPNFAPSSRTAGASRRRQLHGSIPRRGTAGARGRCPEPPGRGAGSLRARAGEAGSAPGLQGVPPPGDSRPGPQDLRGPSRLCRAWLQGAVAGGRGRREGQSAKESTGGGPFGWVCPFPGHSHDSAVSSQQFTVIIKWEWAGSGLWSGSGVNLGLGKKQVPGPQDGSWGERLALR